MNILITGGSGFVGRSLADQLKKNHFVTILCRSNYHIDGVETIIRDINELIASDIEGFDLIYHCASTIDNSHIHSENPETDYVTNCLGSIKLFDLCKKYNPKVKIIYTSSFFAGGNNKNNPLPLSLYGSSKLSTEHICNIYNNVFNMNILVCRLSNIYGVGETLNNKKAALNRMIYNALNNVSIKLFNGGSDIRDYLYIDDCIEILISLIDKSNDQIYEVGSSVGYTMKQITDIIHKYTDCVVLEVEDNNPMNIKSYISNDYWEVNTSLDEGIKKTIEWYKNEI